jgi:hypothetical protein
MKSATLVLIFSLGYLAAGLVSAVWTRNLEFVFYLAAAPFLIAAVAYFHVKIGFPVSLLWCLSVLGLLHSVGGLVPLPEDAPVQGKPLLYNLWLVKDILKYDQAVHAYGNGLATWVSWHLLRYSISQAMNREVCEIPVKPVFMLVCFLAGLGIGAFNEVAEFWTTYLVEDNNVGDYQNTGWDLVFNTIGGALAVALIWFRRQSRLRTKPLEPKRSFMEGMKLPV